MPDDIVPQARAETQGYPALLDSGLWPEWEEWAKSATDAPSAFLTVAGMAAVAAAIGRRGYIEQGARRIYPTLWIMFTAGSGAARKSTTVGLAADALAMSGLGRLLLPQTVSPETLLEIIADRNEGLFTLPEYSAVARSWTKQRNADMSALLAELYDAPPERTKIRKDARGKVRRYVVSYPVLSILAASTPDYIDLSTDDAYGGYWARWLLVPAERDREVVPWPDAAPIPKSVTDALTNIARKDAHAVRMPDRSSTAWALYVKLYEGAMKRAGDGGPAQGMWTRLGVTAVKLALVLQAGAEERVPEVLSEEAMECAVRLAKWHAEAWERWLGEVDDDERLRQRILGFLRQVDKDGAPCRAIYRALHVPADTVRTALSGLQEDGEILTVLSSGPKRYRLPEEERSA